MIFIRNYKITSLCICTIIGAGFATGKELVSYFADYGKTGFFSIFFAAILFSAAIKKTMESPCRSLSELLLPYPLNKLLLLTAEFFLLVLYSAMLSASGEVIFQLFSINKGIGSLITALVTSIVILKGYNMVSSLSEVLFVPIVLIIFTIGITTVNKNISIPSPTVVTPKAVLSPFIYVSYNMLTAIPLLIALPDKHLYKSCANQTGIVIFMLSAMLLLPLYTHYSDICTSSLPIMVLLNGGTRFLYQFLLMLAIFSTAVSAAYSLKCSIKNISSIKSILYINILAVIISLLGFDNIVNKVYFIFGIVGLLILAALFMPRKTQNHYNN